MRKERDTKFYRVLTIALILMSFIPYGLIFLLPYLSLSTTQQAFYVSAMVVCAEGIQWFTILLVGRRLIKKYKRQLNPRNWFGTKKVEVLVFKTSVSSQSDISKLKPLLDRLPGVSGWNFDLEDCDNILRVESATKVAQQVVKTVEEYGYSCEELI